MTTDVGPPMTGKPHDPNEIQADRSEYFTNTRSMQNIFGASAVR